MELDAAQAKGISTHSLLAEGDGPARGSRDRRDRFQPTPSSRRETRVDSRACQRAYFNPLPPRGGRRYHHNSGHRRVISTHSLLAEGDALFRQLLPSITYFNPLPPRGGRPAARSRPCRRRHFNPLPPRGGRLDAVPATVTVESISTHSLLAEGDTSTRSRSRSNASFQPTPSSRRETGPAARIRCCTFNFNPLPPRGGRLGLKGINAAQELFQPTPSSRRETAVTQHPHW